MMYSKGYGKEFIFERLPLNYEKDMCDVKLYGDRVRTLRKAKPDKLNRPWSANKLSEALTKLNFAISCDDIKRIERGYKLNLKYLAQLAYYFNCSMAYIFGRTIKPEYGGSESYVYFIKENSPNKCMEQYFETAFVEHCNSDYSKEEFKKLDYNILIKEFSKEEGFDAEKGLSCENVDEKLSDYDIYKILEIVRSKRNGAVVQRGRSRYFLYYIDKERFMKESLYFCPDYKKLKTVNSSRKDIEVEAEEKDADNSENDTENQRIKDFLDDVTNIKNFLNGVTNMELNYSYICEKFKNDEMDAILIVQNWSNISPGVFFLDGGINNQFYNIHKIGYIFNAKKIMSEIEDKEDESDNSSDKEPKKKPIFVGYDFNELEDKYLLDVLFAIKFNLQLSGSKRTLAYFFEVLQSKKIPKVWWQTCLEIFRTLQSFDVNQLENILQVLKSFKDVVKHDKKVTLKMAYDNINKSR